MPVRSRRNKRRTVAGLDAWETALESEFDFFGELAAAGIDIDPSGRPSKDAAKAAWQLYGDEFMANFGAKYPNGAHFVPWALREFGNP